MTVKLLGLQDDDARTLRWPAGAPYRLRFRVFDSDETAQSLDGRVLVMSIYAGSTELAVSEGEIDSDSDGDFALFAFGGDVSADNLGRSACKWQVGEVFAGPATAPMLEGPVNFAPAAPSVSPGGTLESAGAYDDASWTPATETLEVVESGVAGPRGPMGDPTGLGPFVTFPQKGTLYDLQAMAGSNGEFDRIQGGCVVGRWRFWLSHTYAKVARQSLTDPNDVEFLSLAGLNADFPVNGPLGLASNGQDVFAFGHSSGPTRSTWVARFAHDEEDFPATSVDFLDIGADLPASNVIGIGGIVIGRYCYAMISIAASPAKPVYLRKFDTITFTEETVEGLVLVAAPVFPLAALMASMTTDGEHLFCLTYNQNMTNFAVPAEFVVTRVLLSDFTKVDATAIGSTTLTHVGLAFDGSRVVSSPSDGLPMKLIDTRDWPSMQSVDLEAGDVNLDGFSNGSNEVVKGRYVAFAPVEHTLLLCVDAANPTVYQTCDLTDTDPDALTNVYSVMLHNPGTLALATGAHLTPRVGMVMLLNWPA